MNFGSVLEKMSMYAPFPEDPQPRFRREGWGGEIFYNPIHNIITYKLAGICSQYLPDTPDMMAIDWEQVEYGDKEENA